MFCSKMHNFHLILKIFIDCVEWTFKHPHVKHVSDQVDLNFSHNLSYN